MTINLLHAVGRRVLHRANKRATVRFGLGLVLMATVSLGIGAKAYVDPVHTAAPVAAPATLRFIEVNCDWDLIRQVAALYQSQGWEIGLPYEDAIGAGSCGFTATPPR